VHNPSSARFVLVRLEFLDEWQVLMDRNFVNGMRVQDILMVESNDTGCTGDGTISARSFQRLAVIFCSKNCEKTIGNAVAAVKQTGFASMETITLVVDGFSTDNTVQLAKEAAGGCDRAARQEISWKRNSHEGRTGSW
jgi:hypothetical protein